MSTSEEETTGSYYGTMGGPNSPTFIAAIVLLVVFLVIFIGCMFWCNSGPSKSASVFPSSIPDGYELDLSDIAALKRMN